MVTIGISKEINLPFQIPFQSILFLNLIYHCILGLDRFVIRFAWLAVLAKLDLTRKYFAVCESMIWHCSFYVIFWGQLLIEKHFPIMKVASKNGWVFWKNKLQDRKHDYVTPIMPLGCQFLVFWLGLIFWKKIESKFEMNSSQNRIRIDSTRKRSCKFDSTRDSQKLEPIQY